MATALLTYFAGKGLLLGAAIFGHSNTCGLATLAARVMCMKRRSQWPSACKKLQAEA